MPRSTDPRNYGPFYDKLAELMDRGEQEIKLTMPGRLAIYHRNNFYAFINAWKHEAQAIGKRKLLTSEQVMAQTEHAIRMEDVLRKYLVVLTPEPSLWPADTNPDVELRFIVRGMDERQASVINQLDTLISQSTGLTYDEVKDKMTGTRELVPVDGKKIIDEWEDMTGGHDITLEELDTSTVTQDDIDALTADPPVKDDLSDLITESNSPTSQTKDDYIALMTGHLTEEQSKKKT